MPIQASYFPLVAGQGYLIRPSSKIEDFQRRIIAPSNKLNVCGCKSNPPYAVAMCRKFFDVVEVGLPVFHKAILVTRYQPFLTVRVACCTNTNIVCLHDCLEIEAHAIP